MLEWNKVAGYLLAPLTLAFAGWLAAGLLYWFRKRKPAVWIACCAVGGLWLAALPVSDQALTGWLEEAYPALTVEATPAADAILILGGALVSPHPPRRPHLGMGPAAGRVWHAAMLYRAGKAKWIVIAAGGAPMDGSEPPEAQSITAVLLALGVPRSAILVEDQSRNTRENAMNSRRMVESIGARKVLLVTSATHMRRALATFRRFWADTPVSLTPAVTDVRITDNKYSPDMWLPSLSALENVTKAMKEYAGLAALAII